jgi:hypothetical protein
VRPEQIDALATRLMELINSQLRSPTHAEIVKVLFEAFQTPADADGTTGATGASVERKLPKPTVPDLLDIARDEARRFTSQFAYADIRFRAQLDPHTDNIMVIAQRGDDESMALAFAITRYFIDNGCHTTVALHRMISQQCAALGDAVLKGIVLNGFIDTSELLIPPKKGPLYPV